MGLNCSTDNASASSELAQLDQFLGYQVHEVAVAQHQHHDTDLT
jgi:hypothetical protein